MAVTYGFYNSSNGDRTYDARQMSSIFDGIIEDGVYASIGDNLIVKARSEMTVSVGTGRAWFNHTWTLNDAILVLTLEESDLLFPRIDAVVLEVDETITVRQNSIKVVTGTAASTAEKPTLTNTDDVHQYPLAYITVPYGATEITQSNIENCVGTTEAPFVTGVLETLDVSQLLLQWEAQWDENLNNKDAFFEQWFSNMRNQLTTDAAGNLQQQIDILHQATFYASSWESDSSGWYTQTSTLSPVGAGGIITANSTVMSGPMVKPTTNLATNKTLQKVLGIINTGYISEIGDNTITLKVSPQPTSDITVIWAFKEGV